MVHFFQLLVKKCRVRVELWDFTMNRSCRFHYHSIRSPFSILYHGTFMCPLPGASELLDRRHPNFRDFGLKQCRTPALKSPAVNLPEFLLMPEALLRHQLEPFLGHARWCNISIYATCHRVTKRQSIDPSSFAALKFMGVLKRLAWLFFPVTALQHLTFHHCIRHDQTHMRTHTQT